MPLFSSKPVPEASSFTEGELEKRTREAKHIITKFNGERIPIVVERAKSSAKTIPLIDQSKYLVPSSMTFGQFVLIIRRRIKLAPNQAIFLYVNNVLPPATVTLGQLYQEHKDSTGFISCLYSNESTYGKKNV